MIGRITYWNNPKGFGFITVASTDSNGAFQQQYFFHHSNFRSSETPLLGGIVVFNLGEPVAIGKKIQAIGIRYATPAEIEQTNYIRSFGGGADALKAGVL